MKRTLKRVSLVCLILWVIIYTGNDMIRLVESDQPSQSHGTSSDGYLTHGKRLPTAGRNFVTYSRIGSLIGRTAVHHQVRDAILDAYSALEQEVPDVTYVYGETGWPSGGAFSPHKTHRNGLSVDFMVPVLTPGQRPATLPTWPWNKFGYNIEFDDTGKTASYAINYAAIAAHLHQLQAAAHTHGLRITRVIFDPVLQPYLFADPQGERLQYAMTFSHTPSWVRHDEHYHVDFALE